MGLICERVLLVTASWSHWMGVSGVVRRDRVRWEMGSSMLVSVLFVVSGGGMMFTFGDKLGGRCMT